ncbi:bifunctional metallophosphatase/5'-nucleotidase [Hazenella sp. IB182353]|uniref:bifunctional metallophosphatase/5'-nucleotidase n=1 Tax=Polycladospora coralii TaxID=2771432 RepID=UPI0017469EA8|nr:bifunctional UDP-sugar hydrolase/5'-nucleotidase [Polycladospora coralii]MBS7531356.1 bifunctional metallophosphatase/5'-nucleotidase [Polycladospora coralii]
MDKVVSIHLLHTNDIHSHFDRLGSLYQNVRSLQRSIDEREEPHLLLDIGDHIDRERLETEGTHGKVNRAVLDRFGYDLITFGNNELLTVSKAQLNELYQEAPFSVISTNITEVNTQMRPNWLYEEQIYTLNAIKIGFLAVTIPYEEVYELMGWKLGDPLTILQKKVASFRKQVDIVILLSHLGLQNDDQLATHIPEIDVIIGAHTHHLLTQAKRVGNTYMTAAGKFAEHLGHIELQVCPQTRKLVHVNAAVIATSSDPKAEPEIDAILSHYKYEAEKTLAEPVCTLSHKMEISWERESPLGNALVDGIRDWVGTDIALVNSGQILNGLKEGQITRKDLHAICPHPIHLVKVALKGQDIRQALEESLLEAFYGKKIKGYGFRGDVLGQLCVAGLQVVYQPDASAYQKIKRIYVGQALLKDDKIYEVATIDMLTFGVGFTSIQKGAIIKKFLPGFLREVLAQHLQNNKKQVVRFDKRYVIEHPGNMR